MRALLILLLAVGLMLAGCDGSPPTGEPPTDEPPTDGTLVVSTSTAGEDPDEDGYLLTVDDADSLHLNPTGTAEVDLAAGRHTLRLLGVADQCSVAPETSLDIDIPPGDRTPVAFEVSCPATGTRIMTRTTGQEIDQDGYRVAVDDEDRGAIPANGTLLIRLDPGSRTLALTGLAPNCAVDGPVSQTVTIVVAEVASIEFAVVCTATPASPTLAFDSNGDIYVVHMDGSNLRRLTFDGSPNSYNWEAAWSPDGSRIAFSKSDGQWGAEIYDIAADGTSPTRLSPEGAYDDSPTWSPDGNRIAFENRRDNRSGGHIFVMNADGTNRLQLTTNRQPNSSPAWSPDGRRIAYVTYADTAGDGGTDIYLIDADGTNRVRLTTDPAYDSDPTWSPDGSRIAFFGSGGSLFVVDADGTNLAGLTPARSETEFSWSHWPAWSPDGHMIAFTRATDCYWDPYGDPSCHIGIWVQPVSGGPMSELPLGRGFRPSWRP